MGKLVFKIVFPLLVLVIGAGVGVWFFSHPDEAKKRQHPPAQEFLVETGHAEFGNYAVNIEAMGQVMPAMEISLKPQISGEIIIASSELVPGGFLLEDDPVLYIDIEDYELVVKKQSALLKQAEADYRLEMGRQDVAHDELEILARTTGKKLENTALALRAPQLDQARAEMDKAQSELDMAKLDLRRTKITSPFNALVIDRQVTLGDKVTTQDTLATLVNTDEYWIELSVPVNELKWLIVPGEKSAGSAATIIMDGGRGQREGKLLKLTGTLDQESRFAGLLVSVSDPLLLNTENDEGALPLILNDYVKVILEGKRLEKAARIPLSWLRDGNIVYVAQSDGVLEFRSVEVAYEDRDYTYITSGLSKDDSIIFSNIPVPVDGMKVKAIDGSL